MTEAVEPSTQPRQQPQSIRPTPPTGGASRKKRLLVLSTEFPPGPGGIGTHAWQVAYYATTAGWDVTVLTLQEYVSIREAEEFDLRQPFTVVRLETNGKTPRRVLARLRAVNRLANYLDPDVVLASGNGSVWLSELSPAIRRRPTVAVGHGMEFGRRDTASRIMNDRSYARAAAIVCVSEYTRRRMLASGVRPRRSVVIPNGGDDTVFGPADEPVPPYPFPEMAGRRTILTVGNVGERKGQDIVVSALPDVVAAGVNVHYIVVGLPTRAAELIELAASLGVAERVHIMGRVSVPDLVWAYRSADVFAMTSRQASNGDFEGYGIAVIEAALCGTPAIVTAGSGLEEAVVAGETGLVVPSGDPPAFAAAAVRLFSEPDLLAEMGAEARRRAQSESAWSTRAVEYLALFDSLIGERSSARR